MIKKNLILTLALTIPLVGTSQASGFNYNPGSYKGKEYKELKVQCGNPTSGNSSIFGSPSDYAKMAPILGAFHSEIEAIPGISSSTKSKAADRLNLAVKRKHQVVTMANHTNSMMSRNQGYTRMSDNVYSGLSEQYTDQSNQLQSESDFVTNDAVKDIIKIIGGSDSGLWNTCISWWSEGSPYYNIDPELPQLNGWPDGYKTSSVYSSPSPTRPQVRIDQFDLNNNETTSRVYDRRVSRYKGGLTDDMKTRDSDGDYWWDDFGSTVDLPPENDATYDTKYSKMITNTDTVSAQSKAINKAKENHGINKEFSDRVVSENSLREKYNQNKSNKVSQERSDRYFGGSGNQSRYFGSSSSNNSSNGTASRYFGNGSNSNKSIYDTPAQRDSPEDMKKRFSSYSGSMVETQQSDGSVVLSLPDSELQKEVESSSNTPTKWW